MSTTRNLQLARILKVMLDIIFGLLIFVSVALVLWKAGFVLISRQADYLGTASIPVILGTGEERQGAYLGLWAGTRTREGTDDLRP